MKIKTCYVIQEENGKLKVENESLKEQVAYWKIKFKNKVFAND